MNAEAAEKIQREMNETEPEEYTVIPCRAMPSVLFNGKPRTFGYGATKGSRAGGYTDDEMLWIAEEVTDPERVIEYLIHECTHAQFPEAPEHVVKDFGKNVAGIISAVFRDRGARMTRLRRFHSEVCRDGIKRWRLS